MSTLSSPSYPETSNQQGGSIPSFDNKDLYFHNPQLAVANKEMITFEGINKIDQDIDFGFRLRGHSLNPLLDAATPLFGLVIRARHLSDHNQIPQLYVRVRDEITILLEEIKKAGYDAPTQLAYSYCLCAFVDEAIMATHWGAYSIWAERSMLSIFHDETWGGEKFFTILSRMLLEADTYQDMLELGYYCLVLGFRGKYGMQYDGATQLQTIIRKLQETLRKQRGESNEALLTNSKQNITPTPYQITKYTPLSKYWLTSGAIIFIAYIVYQSKLTQLTTQVIDRLTSIAPL